MKKTFFLSFLTLSVAFCLRAQAQSDSLVYRDIDEVEVVARVEQPADTRTVLDKEQLNQNNTGQNLPYLLSSTPSLVVMSDDGLGIGYTYFRVRGTDHTRINMTVNDVPLNDSESQTVFWVNMTDMASSLSSINIQRGVGTSTNGSSSFGASVNMETIGSSNKNSALKDGKKADITVHFNGGMYNTFREMVSAEVALPNNFRVEARLSKVNSDGYLYRASSDLFSYHGSIGYYTDKTTVAFSAFGGSETTYMAWDGVTKQNLLNDRRYNPAGEYIDKNGNVAYYPNQNDNYKQQHFQLHLQQRISQNWKFKTTLHYTHGAGYYEQMKADKKYSSFGLGDSLYVKDKKTVYGYVTDNNDTLTKTNFIRYKHLDNHFYGLVFAFDYRSNPVDLTIGGAANHYMGEHFGYVFDDLYGEDTGVQGTEFYRNHANKIDANIYAKVNWRIINQAKCKLILYGDLQYRYINYRMEGSNEEGYEPMDINKHFTDFFNPKVGLTYQERGHQLYYTFGMANREPSRDNFKESYPDLPKAERLFDNELGYNYTAEKWHAGVNFYFMYYKDQLVLTGEYSTTGAYLTKNVDKSYRMGAEITAGWKPTEWFAWNWALTFSRNRILDYTDKVDTYNAETWDDEEQTERYFGDVAIAFSPAVTFSNTFAFNYAGFSADIQTNVVSKQYLDNTMSEEAILKPYTVTNLNLRYTLPCLKKWCNITLLAQVNNLFNSAYESNGGNYICQYTDSDRLYYSPWYYAQAGINVHGGVIVNF